MDKIEFVHLHNVKEDQIIDLMNNEKVNRQMPLLVGAFTQESCRMFLKVKKQLWKDHGYGPWAFIIDGEFAGWGGLRPELGEADFALVLHPKFWGWGPTIFGKIKKHAFNQMNLDSITALLPRGRSNSRAITRLGFVLDGAVNIDGEHFTRFRLAKPSR
jgi:RimJ/RimL family protein N-acetyltransferase